MRLNAAKMASLRRRYEKTDEAEAEIAAAFMLTVEDLQTLAEEKGLKRPFERELQSQRLASKAKRGKRAGAKTTKVASIDAKIALVHRFYKSIASQLKKLDEQEGTKSQDRERASRAVSQLATSMEKTVSLHRAIENDKSQGDNPKRREALAHAEDMRRKIAEKLERLNSKRLGEREPENARER